MSGAISVEHEDADGRVRVVADLVRALLAARERGDVALAQLLLALVRAQRRLAAEDDRPFLVRVVGVKWPLLVTRLTSYMLAPISSASVCAPTQASLKREPSRSSVRSHSSAFRLKIFMPQA